MFASPTDPPRIELDIERTHMFMSQVMLPSGISAGATAHIVHQVQVDLDVREESDEDWEG
jgi:hypothetical protein